VHDLRHVLERHFALEQAPGLAVTLMSFGYKNGLPREADIVFDIRFLKNPHWEETLRPLTGHNEAVGEYIATDAAYTSFLDNFKRLIEPLLPRYAAEGKHYLTIAIGCTGGRHRSVYVIEELGKWFEEQGVTPSVRHRDL
jgi:UPF0042 nucleotide-binding protein